MKYTISLHTKRDGIIAFDVDAFDALEAWEEYNQEAELDGDTVVEKLVVKKARLDDAES